MTLIPPWFDRLFALAPLFLAGCGASVALAWLATALLLPLVLLRRWRRAAPPTAPAISPPPAAPVTPANLADPAPEPSTPDAVLQRWERWAEPPI